MRLQQVGLLGLTCLLVLGCSHPDTREQPFTLLSGRVIKVIRNEVVHPGQGANPYLRFEYRTEFKTSDSAEVIAQENELAKEMDEIWSVLSTRADKEGLTSVVIIAVETRNGLISHKTKIDSRMYAKRPNGLWHQLMTL